MTKQQKNARFYGWTVLVACILLAFSINAMGNNTRTFYVNPLSEAFGASKAAVNVALFTVGLLSRTLCGFFYGRFVQRLGIKRLMVLGCALAVGAFLVQAWAPNLFWVGVGTVCYGIAHAIGTFSAFNAILNNWFIKRKGLVLGLVNASVGFSGMLVSPLVGAWIARAGWNSAFFYTALLMAGIAVPALCLIRVRPQEMGQLPLGYAQDQPDAPAGAATCPDRQRVTLPRAMRTLSFWLLVAAHVVLGLIVSPVFSNVAPSLQSMGYDALFVAGPVSIVLSFGFMVGNVLTGLIYDRFGLKTLIVSTVGINALGILAMAFVTRSAPGALLYLSAACIGYGNALTLGLIAHLINHIYGYGRTDFAALHAFLFATNNAGAMFGAPLAGAVFDWLGSYTLTFYAAAAGLVLVAALLLTAIRRRPAQTDAAAA
nr:MFS transporter [Maliibacterium massiliense]